MASSSKRARVNLVSAEIMLEKIFNDENSADGMDSGEESDLDRQLENESGESRWEVNKGNGEMVAIEHVVLRCEVVRLRSPFCVWFLCRYLNLIKIWLQGLWKVAIYATSMFLAMRCDAIQAIWKGGSISCYHGEMHFSAASVACDSVTIWPFTLI